MVRIEDNLYNSSFPQQKLPLKKKDEKWQHDCVNYIIGEGNVTSGGTKTRFGEVQSYYNLYNSIFDEKDFKRITNPFKVDDGFPATPQDFNIIRPKVDLLIGEETKRPMNFRVVRTSQEATSELMDTEKEMLMQYLMAQLTSKMGEEEAAQFQQQLQSGEIMPPEAIAKYMSKDYKDVIENTAYHTLTYLREKLSIDNEFIKGWKDALISGYEVYYVGVLNSEPYMECVNPIEFAFEEAPDLEFIEDASWCCRRMKLPIAEIYDRYYDKLEEKDLNKLTEMLTGRPSSDLGDRGPVDNFGGGIQMHIYDNPLMDQKSRNVINVYHCCWKSFKKIFYVTYMDETGTPQVEIADETYKKTGMELDVTPDWIVEVWEGYRAGSDLYFGIQPIEYQHVSIDNPNSQKLPYTGAIYSNRNSKPRSLVSILRPLQYMYIVLWYRLEMAIARDKGKVVNMDITQIPKSMNITPERWMHYLSSVGVNFINPYEEGWNVPGREGGKPATFNQITALDLTMSNVIAEYIQLMDKIEQLAGTISGITEQREGAISSSELVGNVERSVVQSSHITEPLFWVHNQCKRHALNMLLDTAKGAWSQTGKKKLSYIFDNGERAYIDIQDKFFYEDMDVFVSDTSKDMENIQKLQQLIQPAMQNGASLLEAAEVLTNDNFNIIKQKLKEMQERQEQQMQQQQQAEQEQAMQLQQMQNEQREQELMLEEAKMELERYKIDADNQTKIAVAEISAYRGSEEKDANMNGIPDPMEIAKDATQQRKIASDEYTKRYEARQKREIEDKKIQLEEKRMKHEMELQKQKDDAAMEREKIKARTALKNKTSSGK